MSKENVEKPHAVVKNAPVPKKVVRKPAAKWTKKIILQKTDMEKKGVKDHLKNILPSPKGYIIRPYVNLEGQRDGYRWIKGQRGYWRSFLTHLKKKYTLADTGKSNIVYDQNL